MNETTLEKVAEDLAMAAIGVYATSKQAGISNLPPAAIGAGLGAGAGMLSQLLRDKEDRDYGYGAVVGGLAGGGIGAGLGLTGKVIRNDKSLSDMLPVASPAEAAARKSFIEEAAKPPATRVALELLNPLESGFNPVNTTGYALVGQSAARQGLDLLKTAPIINRDKAFRAGVREIVSELGSVNTPKFNPASATIAGSFDADAAARAEAMEAWSRVSNGPRNAYGAAKDFAKAKTNPYINSRTIHDAKTRGYATLRSDLADYRAKRPIRGGKLGLGAIAADFFMKRVSDVMKERDLSRQDVIDKLIAARKLTELAPGKN